jgi:GT2 family glycosyltransferase
MQLSVIILNYNVRFFLEQCVLSVQKALENIDGEIIVIDNNSTDDSCAMMRERFPKIKLIANTENFGFPKGNNIGVKQAQGDYLCILNPDTVVAEDTFEKVLAFAISKPDLGIVGCKLIDGTGKFLSESKRGIPTPFVAITKIFGLYKLFPKSKLFGKYYAQHLTENETGKVDILVGAFMVLKRNLYLEIGGFDENCFMYSDDIDLSYMVLKTGKSNYYFHETTVIHYKGESTIKDGLYMKRFREAMQFFYKKHFQVSMVFDVFMKLGAFFFSVIKKSQAVNSSNNVEEYVLFSNDENLRIKVENLLGKKVHRAESTPKNTINSLTRDSKKKLEVLWDNNCWSNQSIIDFMSQHRNSGYTFKIQPRTTRFLIGSNDSNDRGQVIEIKE